MRFILLRGLYRPNPLLLGRKLVRFWSQTTAKLRTLKVVPTAFMSDALNYSIKIGRMPWPKTQATHCHAQLKLRAKGAIKGLIVWP